MDQLLQPPATPLGDRYYERRLDKLAAQMGPDVALDADRWPIDWGEPQSFEEALLYLKRDYLDERRVYLYQTQAIANGGVIPDAQPAIVQIEFGPLEANPASGNQAEEYFTLTNPNNFAADISGWTVTGDVDLAFRPGVVIPPRGIIYVSPDVAAFRRPRGQSHWRARPFRPRRLRWASLRLRRPAGAKRPGRPVCSQHEPPGATQSAGGPARL